MQYRTEDWKIPYRPTEPGKQWERMAGRTHGISETLAG
ncbi:hypothetical protein COO91_07777 [Nostoc flagelliforme CCNUN1]|uniref:Uncharacterized protein n=1 Tax=Nostoc flagelliforme CCNUN1 TaxID=2038116 RepID=A0A2K8T3Y1_9NOSO|nr:hypothetical protein COO91_07777 [Nostoc flagelliforme CCNUN1]